jgi:hypothetical protein
MITYNHKQLCDLAFASTKEWLLTDGDGGFASSTVSFMNTRRQHSLLTISLNQPLNRMTFLNKVDEEVIIDGKSYFLGSNQYPGTVFPEGYKLLSKFTFDYFPEALFDLDGAYLTKKILMPRRSNSVFIHFDNRSKKKMVLRLLPLVSFRHKDSIRKAGDGFWVDELPDGVRIIAEMNLPKLYLKLSQMYNTSPESRWYYNFVYSNDSGSYENDREDLFNIGYWETELEPGKGVTLAASTRDLAEFDYKEIESHYKEFIDHIRTSSGLPKRYFHLAEVAANHLVRSRSIRSEAIMGGYPYGSINLREALLALDGISWVANNGGKIVSTDGLNSSPPVTSTNFDVNKVDEKNPRNSVQSYEQGFLYDVTMNEVNGFFPSEIDESTLQVNYDDPLIPFFLSIALARYKRKSASREILLRYLPILEGTLELLIQNYLKAKSDNNGPLLMFNELHLGGPRHTMSDAAINALWYNFLKVIQETRSLANLDSKVSTDDLARSIEERYFDAFFDRDGDYKNKYNDGEVTFEMTIPLVVHYTPLTESQRTIICKTLAKKFLNSYSNPKSHSSPHHACNLVAIYLTEASSQLGDCAQEFSNMKWYIKKLLSLEDFTNCINGLPECGATGHVPNRVDVSSAVVVGEAIRIVKELKLK